MRRLYWILLLSLVVPCQPAAAADPHAAEVDAVFADIDSTHSAGCAAAVYRDGEIVYANGYGMANLDHGVAITPSTVFDIGSTSKQFTAAAIVLLALDGKLALDDDIREYIPEMPEYERPVTIRHLLHHTSGVRDYGALWALSGRDEHDVVSYQDLVDLTARQKHLNFPPGDAHLYSNTGYILLAVIVERVAGTTFGHFLDERIFGPLGMAHTFVYEDRDRIVPHRATGYSPGDDGRLRMDHIWNFALGGDGQVYTTVEDLLLWDGNFYDPEVGGDELLDMMLTRGVLSSGEQMDYALGLYHGRYRGVETVHHGGAWGGFRAQLIRVPDHHMSAAVLCNLGTSGPDARARKLLDIYLGDVLEPIEEPPTTEAMAVAPEVLAGYEGQYQLEIGALFAVVMDGGELFVEAAGMPRMKLVAVSETEFDAPDLGARIAFTTDASGRATGLVVNMASTEISGTRIEQFHPDAGLLAECAGDYSSDELDTVWRMAVEDGHLVMHVGRASDFELRFTARDSFVADRFSGTFERDAGGAVSAVVLDAGRVKNLRAVKTQRGDGG